MNSFIQFLNTHFIWGLPMVVFIICTGLFLTFITQGMIFRRFPIVIRHTVKTLFQKQDSPNQKGAISPFQAVCTALAATVGTGNIVGVALAISAGGPGALFWLWISALVGMVIKYCEVTLSVAYRTTNKTGDLVGGPMYYITRGIGATWLAKLFASFGFLASFGIGASVQANSMASSLTDVFPIPMELVGIVVTILAGLVLVGGIKRIAGVAEILVPFMATFYTVGALAVLTINASEIPSALGSVFKSAFTGTSMTGGFLGASAMYACRIGMARGVFTHEAGMGSAPIAHASAANDHPARQGLWGAFEVFVDSIIMCTITGLVILTSGLWCTVPPIPTSAISANAFEQAFTGGRYIVLFGLVLFSFATIIAWYYYGEKCVEYLFEGRPFVVRLYQIIYITFIFIGSVTKLERIWEFSDLLNGLMAIPNLTALLALSPVIRRLSRDFFKNPNEIRLQDTNFDYLLNWTKQQK